VTIDVDREYTTYPTRRELCCYGASASRSCKALERKLLAWRPPVSASRAVETRSRRARHHLFRQRVSMSLATSNFFANMGSTTAEIFEDDSHELVCWGHENDLFHRHS